MAEEYNHDGTNTRRLDRVESDVARIERDVGSISISITELRSDLKGFGSLLARIEQNIAQRENENLETRRASKPNVVSMVAVLVTVVLSMVGGAWLTGGMTSRLDERDIQRDAQMMQMQQQLNTLNDRQWELRQGTPEN